MLESATTAFVTTLVVLLLLRHAAPRLGLVDYPDGHRQHVTPAALVGGLSIFAGCSFSVLMLGVPLGEYRALILGGAVLVLNGVLDDIHDIPYWSRFAAQAIAAALMIYMGGVQIDSFGDLFGTGPLHTAYLVVPLTVFATVGLINAFNMIDGIDGLAGSLLLIPICVLAILAIEGYEPRGLNVLLLVLGCLVAFLIFNFPVLERVTATVFLGDAGSMFLGFLVCWFLIDFSQGPARLLDPVTALWLVAVPLIDTTSVMTRRMLNGRSPFRADRTHVHHVLQHMGLSRIYTLLTIKLVAISAAVFGIVADFLKWPEWVRFGLFIVLFFVFFAWLFRYTRAHDMYREA